MGFFSGKKNISIPQRSFEDESDAVFKSFQGQQGQIAQGNVAADIATTQATLGAAGRFGGQIRGLQQELNPELFQLQGAQDRLATGAIGQALEREALGRIGTGITEDERRTVQQGSRQASTDRGLFRSNPAIFDEFSRVQQADRQARLQNAQFGSNILSNRLGQLGTARAGRADLFLDPRNTLVSSGVGLTGGQLFSGISGLQSQIGASNQEASFAEQAANQKQGFGRSLIEGAVGGFAGQAGAGLGMRLF